jgi:hypothetical protein
MVNALSNTEVNRASTHRVVILLTAAELSIVDGVAREKGFRSRAEAFRELLRERRDQGGASPAAT